MLFACTTKNFIDYPLRIISLKGAMAIMLCADSISVPAAKSSWRV